MTLSLNRSEATIEVQRGGIDTLYRIDNNSAYPKETVMRGCSGARKAQELRIGLAERKIANEPWSSMPNKEDHSSE